MKTIWMGPLVAGLGFALAYGVTERLLSFNVGEMIRFGPRFDVQVFPGTSLENLRLRFGDQTTRIQAELDLLELDKQLKQEQEAAAKAKALKEEQAAAAAATTEPAAAPEQGEATDKPPAAAPVPAPAVAPAP
ncbi:MAG: hypothetical protein FJ057_07830 [Cyanobacteria bacterium K_DeepCast_0m_m1_088]|nr:hypothetical protein [Cyanobacteria bacterium K_DeepCast_0m_m1_088]